MRAGETNAITVLFCREGALGDKYMFMVLNITFVCVCVQCCVLRCVRCTGFRRRIKDGCWSGNRCQRRRCRSLYPNSYWARSYASTRAGQCWCLSSVERLRRVFLSFIGRTGSDSDRKTSRFARFTVVRLKNMNPDASFTMLMLMGKIKNSLGSSSSGSRKWRSSVTFHLTGTSSAMTSSITVTTWLAVIRKCSLSSTNSQVRWIKGPNHQTLAVGGESSNDELISSQLFW